ncbi:glycine zipper 2TM domain-containing protein [uncultured Roseobacter sp.]|uniref:glycine zipper 2TM domain-containing protein n=1 Tax=uncultured Roseobacter sp. TaxID=114847 RepID=UPI002617A42A|nr:glycine zipper 2TM domain-containing protein [uncultured Roseobacter sp.]
MKKFGILSALGVMALLQACATTPQQQRQVGCTGAGVAGALAGAAVGNQLGGGSGRDILTAGGAVAGGLAGNNAAGC